jgi:hypothetical protein
VTSPIQTVEFFHLQFARLLCAGPDKEAIAIEGGCYLHPDHAEAYGSPEAWDAMQLRVVEYLDRALASGLEQEP